MRNRLLLVAICGVLAAAAAAQKTVPSAPPALMPLPNLAPLLAQLEQAGTAINGDLGRLRIEKWKTDSDSKRQVQANADSIQRNLTAALPGMIAAVRTAPDNMAAGFKLYRNLNALYDVLASLAESAGAFGPRDDYDTLATDSSNLDQIRRNLADRLEKLAAYKDSQVIQLQTEIVRIQAGAAAATPPKKIIVDENEPVKKPAKKKKAPTKPAQPKPQQTPPPK